MPTLRSLMLNLAGIVPQPVKALVYRHPALLRPLAKLLKHAVPAKGDTVVRITDGPNRGLRIVVDRSVPNFFWLNPDYEPGMQAALTADLRSGCMAADIGAHMGFDTLHMAGLVGQTGHVYAFEPDPANARKLRRNCELNRLHQVSCHEVCVSSQAGAVRFRANGTTTSHIASSDEPATITVASVTLDDMLESMSAVRLDLVKIDVEGAELAVLTGARNTLKRLRPVWLIEIHSEQNLADCGRLLLAAGYRLESLSASDYYADAVTRLAQGAELPLTGFDVGHIRAIPVRDDP